MILIHSAQLYSVIDTMKSRNMDPLTLSKYHWPDSGATNILHSGMPSSHSHDVAILLCPWAKVAWEAAGSVFQLVSELILQIRLKRHLSYMSVLSTYAFTNPPNSTYESAGPSNDFYEQLQLTLSSVPASYLLWVVTDPLGTQ